jgi:PDZ domain
MVSEPFVSRTMPPEPWSRLGPSPRNRTEGVRYRTDRATACKLRGSGALKDGAAALAHQLPALPMRQILRDARLLRRKVRNVNRIVVRGSECLGVVLALGAFQASAQPAPSLPDQRAADLAALDRFVRDSYAFLPTKATDWNRVMSALMPRARAARDHTGWLHVLEEALDALYDGHAQLNTNAADSWRPVPYGLWVQPNHGRYVVTAVQRGSLPERTGVQPGDELVAIDGVSVSQLYESRRPRFLTRADPVADEWALASAVAGRHNSRYEFLIRRAGRESVLTPSGTTPARDDVEWKRVRSDIGIHRSASFLRPPLCSFASCSLSSCNSCSVLIAGLDDCRRSLRRLTVSASRACSTGFSR